MVSSLLSTRLGKKVKASYPPVDLSIDTSSGWRETKEGHFMTANWSFHNNIPADTYVYRMLILRVSPVLNTDNLGSEH